MNGMRLFHLIGDGLACHPTFLGFVSWNSYLKMDNNCNVVGFHLLGADSSLLLIGLAVLEDLFRVAGLLAVVFIIISGARLITANGQPAEAEKAREGILSSLIGLAITLFAVVVVRFVGAQFSGGQAPTFGNLNLNPLPNPAGTAGTDLLQSFLSIGFGVLGAIAFLVIVIAGFQYVLSQGNPQTTTQAKNIIVYALIGLIIAIVAESIVSFVVNHP